MEFSGVTTSVLQLEHEGVTITVLMCTQDNEQKMYIYRLCPLCNSCWTMSQDPDCTVLYLKFCFSALHCKICEIKDPQKKFSAIRYLF